MHIFVTGGSGLTGPAVVTELIKADHTVTGLARSDAAAARLEGLGASVVRGDLSALDALSSSAADSDGVLHMAFGGDWHDPAAMGRADAAAIEAMGNALAGSDRPLVMTSGTLVMTPGRVSVETDEPDESSSAHFRLPGERAALALAEHGVRSSVVRLAPTVHGPGDVGFIPALIAASRKIGAALYVEDGANRWPAVHRLDAAVLFRLALESAPAGSVLHATDEVGITFRTIADAIGQGLGVPSRSETLDHTRELIGNAFLAGAYAIDAPASSLRTRGLLGWTPTHPTLLAELADGDYFDEAVTPAF